MRKYICPVPIVECTGTLTGTSAGIGDRGMQKARKLHASSDEARRCHCRYLHTLGYKQLSRTTLESPDGPVLVLNRNYPAMRHGKEGRHQPKQAKGVFV